MNRFTVLLALLFVNSTSLAQTKIAVVGASDDSDLMARWAHAEKTTVRESGSAQYFQIDRVKTIVLAPKAGASLSAVANTLYEADVAIIVLDTTVGPLPVNRTHAIMARQASVPAIAVMMADVDELFSQAPADAQELLVLEEAEIREVLALYEVGGPDTLVFHDSNNTDRAPLSVAGGLPDVSNVVAKLGVSRPAQSDLGDFANAQAHIYLLTDGETNYHAASISESASMDMWSEGRSTSVVVDAEGLVSPGDVAVVTIRTAEQFRGQPGSRMLLMKDSHVVGVGVFAEVSN